MTDCQHTGLGPSCNVSLEARQAVAARISSVKYCGAATAETVLVSVQTKRCNAIKNVHVRVDQTRCEEHATGIEYVF